MPLFGSRMVCETANYKYIEERNRVQEERENKLARWVREKSERKAALKDLKTRIRQASVSQSRNNSISQGTDSIHHDVNQAEDQTYNQFGQVISSSRPSVSSEGGVSAVPQDNQSRTGDTQSYKDVRVTARDMGHSMEMGGISMISPPKIGGYTRLEDVHLEGGERWPPVEVKEAAAEDKPKASRGTCPTCVIM